jgi:membrane dipeptidase
MTDDMIRALAAAGGVIQINFYPLFLDNGFKHLQEELVASKRPSYKLIADHIDHVVSLVGVEHVGIGSDFDGIEVTPDGMEDISMMPKLFRPQRMPLLPQVTYPRWQTSAGNPLMQVSCRARHSLLLWR